MAKGKKRLKEPKKRKSATAAAGVQSAGAEAEPPGAPEPEAAAATAEQSAPATPEEAPEQVPEEIPLEIALDQPDESAEHEEEPEGEEASDEDEAAKYRRGMFRSRKVLSRPFVKAATRRAIGPEFWEEAADALIAADSGVPCATDIVEGARRRILAEGIRDMEGLKEAFREEVADTLRCFGEPPDLPLTRPHVIFIVGVNGVGKTTTAAKIGNLYKENGFKVIFAAADTFRAAGDEQMELWARRVGVPVVRHKAGGDPAAVVFDALESANARGMDLVIVDTAGRLHTKKNLMDELNKMWRVADRQIEGAPEAVLVIDATTGQNGVNQARIFSEALDVSSIALTKMDGSAKGGVVLAIGKELGIPVEYIGVGEGMSDLRQFDPDEYARALF